MKTLKVKIWALSLLVFFCFFFLSHNLVYSTSWATFNQYLVTLLHDETDPFFPDTIRHSFLRVGVKSTSSICKIGEYVRIVSVCEIGEGTFPTITDTFYNILGVSAVWRKDSSYALPYIDESDVARKKIATTTAMQYWYTAEGNNIYLHPPPSATDSVLAFMYGIPYIGYSNPAYDHLIILYALHLCYQRQGERGISRFIEGIYNSLLQDMYLIIENRRVDVTIKKEVLSK